MTDDLGQSWVQGTGQSQATESPGDCRASCLPLELGCPSLSHPLSPISILPFMGQVYDCFLLPNTTPWGPGTRPCLTCLQSEWEPNKPAALA